MTKEMIDTAVEMYQDGVCTRKIANELHRSVTSVNMILRPYREMKRKDREERRAEALKLYQSGVRAKECAKKFNIPLSDIYKLSGETGFIVHFANSVDTSNAFYMPDMRKKKKVIIKGRKYTDITDFFLESR